MSDTLRSRKVSAEERLFNLVLALVSSQNGLSKGEIFATITGYTQDQASGKSDETIERKFERDKEMLRQIGIPLESVPDQFEPENNQLIRYRVSKSAYDLPDVDFSAEETTLIGLASQLWHQAGSSTEAARALTKIRSLGVETNLGLLGNPPQILVSEPGLAELTDAIARHQQARFDYLKPGNTAALTRDVLPLALVQHHGRWHVYAWDLQRHDYRTFLLRRITSRVHLTESAIDWDWRDDESETALRLLDELWQQNVATLTILPGSEADIRLGRRTERIEGSLFSLHYTDPHLLADELTGYGPEVVVHSPSELRSAVIERLRWLLATHSNGSEQPL